MHIIPSPPSKHTALPQGCYTPKGSPLPVCLPLPHQTGPTAPECGGNSGLPCGPGGAACFIDPMTGAPSAGCGPAVNFAPGISGLVWDTPNRVAPDLRPGLFGLADINPGAVAAGTRLLYTASLPANPQGPSSSDLASCIQNDLTNGGVYASVTVNPSYSILGLGGGSITVALTSLIDRGSINDVQNDITYEIQQCGAPVQNVQMSVVSGPSIAGIPSGREPASTAGPCDAKSGVDWMSCQLGIGTPTAIAGGIGIGTVLLIGGFILAIAMLKH